ncbi:MAG TPA: hypothetical protein VF666_14440 [Pyrinomonadaceae bacterium]|jgi:hypothetical protein
MRQRLLLIGLITSALLVGGWGSVLASVLCPHAGSVGRVDAVASVDEGDAVGSEVVVVVSSADETHSCCAMKMRAGENAHCAMRAGQPSQPPSHDPHAATPAMSQQQQTDHASDIAHDSGTHQDNDDAAQTPTNSDARVSTSSSCAHCVGRSGQTRVAVRLHEPNPTRRDAATDVAPRADKILNAPPLVFISTIARQRGAPPGDHARRHLLNSIFLI